MVDSNHYETLRIHPSASQAEIKKAYRRLVKLFHPDSHQETADHEQIIRVNAAYEVLGDAQSRSSYDRQLSVNTTLRSDRSSERRQQQQRTASVQTRYQASRPTGRDADEQLEKWLYEVYQPVNRLLCRILNSLERQIDTLAADPFDDELMEQFQAYLKECRNYLKQAQLAFRSLPNPANVAGAAVHLYYCLNQVADGIEELELFTLNYDEGYLHTGQELFRIATGLRCEAQYAVKDIA